MPKENLDQVLDKVDLSQKTEMGEVAQNVFEAGAGRTNLSEDEICLVFINKLIFKGLNLQELDPTADFMELKKSLLVWSTEKFVEGLGGLQNQRSGGSFGSFVKEVLFRPKQ